MSYCISSDITTKYTTKRVAQLSGDATGVTVNTTVVDQAIGFASAIMKPFVRAYERAREVVTPFTSTQLTLNALCVDLSFFELLKRSPSGLSDNDRDDINRIMGMLKAISKAEIDLEDESVNPAPVVSQTAWNGATRLFSREVQLT